MEGQGVFGLFDVASGDVEDAVCLAAGALEYECPASSNWQVFGFGKVGDERVGGAGVDVVGAVP
ncbi:hypothetical protein ACFYWP_29995, partial [Actinacidiphila glaucinigra]|uniref:hypothetical protein n=1 Tax=Actinacidiphila glaucinigra TaxID=235986 RepID=UPI0036A5AC6A